MPIISASAHLGKSPALERSLAWLRQQIANKAWHLGHTLPSLEQLAQNARVARFTMWKAVRILAGEGILHTQRGSGIVVGKKSDAEVNRQTVAWRTIAQQITECIHHGEFLPGAKLPAQAKLQIRFSTSYMTLNKALAFLVNRRVISRIGAKYAVPMVHAHGASLSVILFAEGIVESNEALLEVIRLSERQAQRMGVGLIRYLHRYSVPFDILEIQRLIGRNHVNGFIVDFWGAGTTARANFLSLLATLYASRKPIAIVDHVGSLDLPEPLHSSSRVCALQIAGQAGGEDIGRYLLQLGHRRVAYLTIHADEAWSRQRLEGIERAFEDAGLSKDNITVYKTRSLPDMAILGCAAAHLSREEIATLYPKMAGSDLENFSDGVSRITPELKLTKAIAQSYRRHAMAILRLYRNEGNRILAEPMRDSLIVHAGSLMQAHLEGPLYHQLVKDAGITAWIGSTDGLGLSGQAFLREHSIDIPGKKSVCGFDNSLKATVGNLTSYDFDTPGLLNQALSFTIGRKDFRKSNSNVIEWPGMLVIRQSTGKAASAA